MFRKLVLVVVIITLAVLAGCGEGQIFGPDTEVFKIIATSRVEHFMRVIINGIEQDHLLTPGHLSSVYEVELRVTRRENYYRGGVQYVKEYAWVTVSLLDLTTNLQSESQEKWVEVGTPENFEFEDNDF